MSDESFFPRLGCEPDEIALKSFFLGPQAENAPWVAEQVLACLSHWADWRKSLYPSDGSAIPPGDRSMPEFSRRQGLIASQLQELLARFEAEVPKFSPRYMGHMFSEISLPALLGHIVTLLHNPNNISGESSRVGVALEDEAIEHLSDMVGFSSDVPSTAIGHFTSGGTIANFEALIRARWRAAHWLSVCAHQRSVSPASIGDFFRDSHLGWERTGSLVDEHARGSASSPNYSDWNPLDPAPEKSRKRLQALYGSEYRGPVILVPENRHYSWKKGASLLGFGGSSLWPVALDSRGRLSVSDLTRLIGKAAREQTPIALVVSVLGTTELGTIDPVHEVQSVLDEWRQNESVHIWHHIDAAYGGFFCSLREAQTPSLSAETLDAIRSVGRADSITLDPHKLGYVPYASGAFITRDRRNYAFASSGGAPYIDFDARQDKGPFTFEGSRSAAGAVATWMTARTFGLGSDGFGRLLERTLRIRANLSERIARIRPDVRIAPGGDTNLLCFSIAREGEKISRSNARSLRIFERFSPRRNSSFIISKTALSWPAYGAYLDEWGKEWRAERDVDEVILLRMCIMNPFLGSIQTNVNYLEEFSRELESIVREAGESVPGTNGGSEDG